MVDVGRGRGYDIYTVQLNQSRHYRSSRSMINEERYEFTPEIIDIACAIQRPRDERGKRHGCSAFLEVKTPA